MNGLDIALAVILFFFFLRGIFRGFIKEVVSIAGLVGGFLLGTAYYPAVADAIKPFIQSPAYRQTIGFVAIFLVASFLISLLGLILDKLIKLTISNVGNSLMGAVLALAKGVVLCAVILLAVTAFIREDTSFFQKSAAWPYFKPITESINHYIPEDLQKALKEETKQLPEVVKPTKPQLGEDPEKPVPWKPVAPESAEPPPPAWPGSSEQ
jgi:membrane protein required for colicin V production